MGKVRKRKLSSTNAKFETQICWKFSKAFATFAPRNEETTACHIHLGYAANWFLLSQFAAFF